MKNKKMRRAVLFIVIVGLVCVLLYNGGLCSSTQSNDLDTWLKEAALGQYAPEEEDWDAVYEAAKGEPPLQIYMSTSRVKLFADSFKKQFPGVKVEDLYIRQADMIPRLNREWQAGVWNVGVLNLSDPSSPYQIPKGSYVSYVPPEYRNLYLEKYRKPVFSNAQSLRGFMYNPELSPDGPPFKSIWDLTTEKFRGKVILSDALRASGIVQQFVTIMQHTDELTADYEARFGEPLKLRERDAGFEWLRRLLENKPHIVVSWKDAAEALTKSKEVMVAEMNFIRMANVGDGTYNMKFAMGITPVDAVAVSRWFAIGAFNKSPNASKLFIYAMMSEEAGRPFFDRGFLNTQYGWKPTKEWMKPITKIKYWDMDPDFYLNNKDKILDLWTEYAP